MSLRTRYEFTLPRGYVDRNGDVHRDGVMRLATARDELEPLRDPTVTGPDDPRLTIVVLARVVESLGTLPMVTPHEIEGLFAADLAYLQDFYGVINFGSQQEFEEFVAAQRALGQAPGVSSSDEAPAPAAESQEAAPTSSVEAAAALPRPGRGAIEEIRSEARH
ncbi:MAG: hypothetical protein NVV70_16670 [Cellulomonas sp.]|nr:MULTISPECIES: hypothetical protein [Cellulomonas]MCR6649682.1 hypothetical protein [Cellulomonas sp.]MCR6705656.1 hypothetical protein [Cellulomonas sp.]GGL16172.1 hypothetical protein GCM10009774_03220 [Cellulomonas gelida]